MLLFRADKNLEIHPTRRSSNMEFPMILRDFLNKLIALNPNLEVRLVREMGTTTNLHIYTCTSPRDQNPYLVFVDGPYINELEGEILALRPEGDSPFLVRDLIYKLMIFNPDLEVRIESDWSNTDNISIYHSIETKDHPAFVTLVAGQYCYEVEGETMIFNSEALISILSRP
jgi:hypothetical protein